MPLFRYEGTTLENKVVRGSVEANTQSEGYAKLKMQNIFAYSVVEKKSRAGRSYRLKPRELAEFSRQVSTMYRSGIPMVQALDILKERVSQPKLLHVYEELSHAVVNGSTMSEAMEGCQGSFPDMIIHMFRAGEANGQLDDAGAKMAKYYDREHKIRGKIRGAMIYPAILATVTLVVVILLFTFILPQIFGLITSGGGELTGITRAMVTISDVLINQWYLVLIVVVGLGYLLRRVFQQRATEVDRYKLKLPILGRLLSVIYSASFARTLSSLYGSGMSMIEAVELSAKTIGNRYLEEQFITAVQKIQNGSPLSYAVDGIDGLERKLISTIYVGEETGRLEFVLGQISQEYEYESATAIERMLTFVEPIMLVIMGIIIALVLASVMGPMSQMYGAIG